jgi:hypothetical protein
MLGAYFYVSFEKQKSEIISEGTFGFDTLWVISLLLSFSEKKVGIS